MAATRLLSVALPAASNKSPRSISFAQPSRLLLRDDSLLPLDLRDAKGCFSETSSQGTGTEARGALARVSAKRAAPPLAALGSARRPAAVPTGAARRGSGQLRGRASRATRLPLGSTLLFTSLGQRRGQRESDAEWRERARHKTITRRTAQDCPLSLGAAVGVPRRSARCSAALLQLDSFLCLYSVQ
jgi:hypothetical protein